MRNNLLILAIIFIVSCNNEAPSDNKNAEDSLLTDTEVSLSSAERLLPWVSDFDTIKNEFYLKQQRKVNPDSLTAAILVNDLNAEWENIKLVLVKASNDTLYVSIPDSDFLGQQMGSAGAQAYMASTTYNLTELKGIKYVNYNMQAGDHVSPGTYSRKSFENYR
jgi:hypothetical protein